MNIVLLSGGSGMRLWPLSNEVRSKQFLKVFDDGKGNKESMLQRMHRMIRDLYPEANITIATLKEQVPSIIDQLGDDVNISVEPCRRDTFPAIALSSAFLHDIKKVPLEEKIVVCPIDPLVEDDYFKLFGQMCETSDNVANLTLMGIKPTYPSEKYGYILTVKDKVIFKEKPTESYARDLIKKGALWNGGVFSFKIGYILEKAKQICGYKKHKDLLKEYQKFEKISFDYAVAEQEESIRVVEYSGEWKDLGTWNTFSESMQESVNGNVVMGENCSDTHVINELSIPIVALGLNNIIVAASPDGILVSDKNASSKLKEYAPLNRPMYEKRMWGEYRVFDFQTLDDYVSTLTEELIIAQNKYIDYQKHNFRNETWTFVKGSGLFLLNGKIRKIKSGDSVFVKSGNFYSIKAIDELVAIVVQTGSVISDKDVEISDCEWNING